MFSAMRGVTALGINIIREIITTPLARRVNSPALSPMGFPIQAESQTLEFPSICLREFDPAFKACWDQPLHKFAYSSLG